MTTTAPKTRISQAQVDAATFIAKSYRRKEGVSVEIPPNLGETDRVHVIFKNRTNGTSLDLEIATIEEDNEGEIISYSQIFAKSKKEGYIPVILQDNKGGTDFVDLQDSNGEQSLCQFLNLRLHI